jgi:hypothetical protein
LVPTREEREACKGRPGVNVIKLFVSSSLTQIAKLAGAFVCDKLIQPGLIFIDKISGRIQNTLCSLQLTNEPNKLQLYTKHSSLLGPFTSYEENEVFVNLILGFIFTTFHFLRN